MGNYLNGNRNFVKDFVAPQVRLTRKKSSFRLHSKNSRCKARKSLGVRRTVKYVGMIRDEAQRPDGLNREIFYAAVVSKKKIA